VIDLNVRVRGNQTYAGFEDVRGPVPAAGEQVLAIEVESGVVMDAAATDIDQEKRLVYLAPDWQSWRDEPEAAEDPSCE
jgi:hypothetical protein